MNDRKGGRDEAVPSPSPRELWEQAHREFPRAGNRRRQRYLDLMREHGHVVPMDHPDAGARNLPCGWPGDKGGEERHG